MKYIISKDQYRRVLLKYLNSFINDFIVDSFEEGNTYRYVKTSNGDEFATLWHAGPITKGCKRELSLDNQFINDFESFIPINRKKVFSEVVLEYFTLKTGIKCDCVEFDYFTGKYKDYETYDDDRDEVITVTDKKNDHYHYKTPKKR
jgi:hypothetical protein